MSDAHANEIKLTLEELGRNAIEWGNQGDVTKEVRFGCASCRTKSSSRSLMRVRASSPRMCPTQLLTHLGHIEQRRESGKRLGGYGIHLIRNLMDKVVWNARGNVVVAIKYLDRPSPLATESTTKGLILIRCMTGSSLGPVTCRGREQFHAAGLHGWPETTTDIDRYQPQHRTLVVVGGCGWCAVRSCCRGLLHATDLVAHVLLTEIAGWQPALPAGEAPIFHSEQVALAEHQVPTEQPGGLRWWWLLVVLFGGGVLSGWIVSRFSPEARGAGTGEAVHAFHHRGGEVSLIAPVTKMVASVITLGSGGSAGREGPIAMVGAGFASWFGGCLHLSSRDRRILLAAGIGGGVAAMFRAPLAGALFAAEVLYSDPEFEADVLIPSFISAIVAHVTFGLVEGLLLDQSSITVLFAVPAEAGLRFTAADTPQLLGYLLVTGAVVVAARAFISALSASERQFSKLPLPTWLVPGLGGLGAGITALVLLWVSSFLVREGSTEALATLGAGYGFIQHAMDGLVGLGGWSAVLVMLIVAFGKMVTTCLTVGSGGSGGAFGPSIVIGGCIGGAVGSTLHLIGGPFAAIAPNTLGCIIMGMAGFLAATYKVPIAGLLMVTEMTGSYQLLLPAMWVCALCYLFSGKRSVVPSQSPARLTLRPTVGISSLIFLPASGLRASSIPNVTCVRSSHTRRSTRPRRLSPRPIRTSIRWSTARPTRPLGCSHSMTCVLFFMTKPSVWLQWPRMLPMTMSS